MAGDLVFQAGKKALSAIREKGLCPDDIRVMAGAAGGPKWLVLAHLDKVLFSDWFQGRRKPLFLAGSSSGAWRFAAVCRKDPVSAVDRFRDAYVGQRYKSKPSPQKIAAEADKILNRLLEENGEEEILSHPFLRLNVMAVRCKSLAASDIKLIQGLGLGGAAALNTINRKGLKFFFERALFYDPRDIPPFFGMDEFPIRKTSFEKRNLRRGLLASGSIPLLMAGVRGIPGAPSGVYRDGGVIDYHMDIPYFDGDGIAFITHYTDRVIPGWLDKKLFWRKPRNTDRVLLVSPSESFLERLPYGKIPDRGDFKRFMGTDRERFAYWNTVANMSERLAGEFMETVLSGRIRERVVPMRTRQN